jgi:anti-sigma factor RsiW
MSCDRTGTLLHAYFDNELDTAAAAEFERHLEQCPECAGQLDSLQTLRSSILGAQLYHTAPVSLRRRLAPARAPWRWVAIAAALLLCALAGWQIASVRPASDAGAVLATELVDAHLRSLQPGHLTDVLSSDQHTVKPWFAGRLDFSPPVRDFAVAGFPLEGGRLEVVQGRTSAALVYGRRKHIVSVFIWPSGHEPAKSPGSGSRNGYQWASWRQGGMQFFAVSDASLADLTDLQHLFAAE